jgi:hypothetical protein
MADMDDIFKDAQQPVSATDAEAAEIGTLTKRAIELQEEIEALSAQVKTRNEELRRITDQDLPEAMDAANCAEFKDKDTGKKITIKEAVTASISKNNAIKAHAWLREHGHESLIKNEIIVPLGKGLDNVAGEIITRLKTEFDVEPERRENVHAQTLGAFCREQLGMGVDLPADLLGMYIRRVAVIK